MSQTFLLTSRFVRNNRPEDWCEANVNGDVDQGKQNSWTRGFFPMRPWDGARMCHRTGGDVETYGLSDSKLRLIRSLDFLDSLISRGLGGRWGSREIGPCRKTRLPGAIVAWRLGATAGGSGRFVLPRDQGTRSALSTPSSASSERRKPSRSQTRRIPRFSGRIDPTIRPIPSSRAIATSRSNKAVPRPRRW